MSTKTKTWHKQQMPGGLSAGAVKEFLAKIPDHAMFHYSLTTDSWNQTSSTGYFVWSAKETTKE